MKDLEGTTTKEVLQRLIMANYHFIVTVVDAETDTIRIPDAFTQRHGQSLNHSVTLRTCDYTEWVVHIDKTDGEIWMTVGWKEFSKENGIKNSFLVYFEYVVETLFLVTIYHKTGCENPGPGYPIESLPAKFFTCLDSDESLHRLKFPEQFSCLFDGRLQNPMLLFTGDGPLWPLHWRTVDGQICLYRGWRQAVTHLSLERGDICVFRYQGDREISMVVCRMSSGEITPSYRKLVLDAPQLTLWTTEVTNYILSKPKPLYIPAFVVKEYFSNKPKEIDVMLPSGKIEEWSLLWSSRDTNEGYLGHGWYEFVTDYKLELNQKIRFFMADLESLIHVEVI